MIKIEQEAPKNAPKIPPFLPKTRPTKLPPPGPVLPLAETLAIEHNINLPYRQLLVRTASEQKLDYRLSSDDIFRMRCNRNMLEVMSVKENRISYILK